MTRYPARARPPRQPVRPRLASPGGARRRRMSRSRRRHDAAGRDRVRVLAARRAAAVRGDRPRAGGRAAARSRTRGQRADLGDGAAAAAAAAGARRSRCSRGRCRVRSPASRCCGRCRPRRCRSRSRSASLATLAARRVRAAHVPAWAAGATAGALTTSTSTNGPPMLLHLLGRGATPEQVRDTLTVCFLGLAAIGALALFATGDPDLPDGTLLRRSAARRARRPPGRPARFRPPITRRPV